MAQALVEQAVVKLLEPVATGNVFWGIAPENQRSAFVTYQKISGNKVRDINGPSGLARSVFQLDIYADDALEGLTLANDIRKILDGFRGTVTIGANSIVIGGVSFQSERDFTEDDTDPKLYRASVDYLFKFEEDI